MRRQDFNKRKPNDNRSSKNNSNQRGLLNMPPGLMNNQTSLFGGSSLFGNQSRMMNQGSLFGNSGRLLDGQGNQGGSLFGNQTGLLGNQGGGMAGNSVSLMATQAGLLRNQLGLLDNQGLVGNQNLLSLLGNRNLSSLMGSQLNSLGPGLNNLQGSLNLGGGQSDAITSLIGDASQTNNRARSGVWMRPPSAQAGILGPPPDGRRVTPLLSDDDIGFRFGQHSMGNKFGSSFQESKHGGESNRQNTSFANSCEVCNWSYNSTFMEHCNTLEHKKKSRLVKKGCLLCKTGKFKNYPDYVKHLGSTKHKQNKEDLNKELEAKRKDAEIAKSEDQKEMLTEKESPIENGDEVQIKPESVLQESTHLDIDEELKMEDVAEGDCDSFIKTETLVYDPNVAVGQNHVISVTGFFCKLCRKFYNNEVVAKVNHCKSEAHFQKYQETLKLK